MRLGLCCIFREAPIRFRTTTAAVCSRLPRAEARAKIASVCQANAASLYEALTYCAAHGIGCFRVMSQILPLKTHPEFRYELGELPGGDAIRAALVRCGELAQQHRLRLTFHPDQFVVLSSPREAVVDASLGEIEYQAEVASWIGADAINIHLGGAYGDKPAAIERFRHSLSRLSSAARARLTVENDDRTYTPSDLLPLCQEEKLPLVYDVHHHRCHPDGLSVAEATSAALTTWQREPLFHISSPQDGWNGPRPQRHHDYIDPRDFPREWLPLDLTVEVEAKAKELAVEKLQRDLGLTRW